MATLQDINAVTNRLQVATDNYNSIQKQIDKYNQAFETYARAGLETQQRAASVMRQALNEYANLKAQQQNNSLKIYEAQKQLDYYRRIASNGAIMENLVPEVRLPYEDTTAPKTSIAVAQEGVTAPTQTVEEAPQPTTPVLSKTSAVSNVVNNTATTTPINTTFNRVAQQNTVRPRATVSSSAITASQGGRFPNTTLSQVGINLRRGTNTPGSSIKYGPGTVVGI